MRRLRLSDLPPKARKQVQQAGAKRFDLADRLLERLQADPRTRANWVREHPCHPEVGGAWDLALVEIRLAIEVHGGTRSKAGLTRSHAGPKGVQRDCAKASWGQIHGWMVLAFTDLDLRDRPEYCLKTVAKALERGRDHAE